MKKLNVPTINGVVQEDIYEINELSYLGKMLSCKESKKRGISYLEIPCAFDIETTNINYPLEDEYEYFDEDIYNYLRKIKIRYTDTIANDISDFEKLRKSYFGKLKLSKKTGIHVDVLYDELSSTYPGYFPISIINPTDQLLKIIEVFDQNTPTKKDFRPYAFMYHWQFCFEDQVVTFSLSEYSNWNFIGIDRS